MKYVDIDLLLKNYKKRQREARNAELARSLARPHTEEEMLERLRSLKGLCRAESGVFSL